MPRRGFDRSARRTSRDLEPRAVADDHLEQRARQCAHARDPRDLGAGQPRVAQQRLPHVLAVHPLEHDPLADLAGVRELDLLGDRQAAQPLVDIARDAGAVRGRAGGSESARYRLGIGSVSVRCRARLGLGLGRRAERGDLLAQRGVAADQLQTGALAVASATPRAPRPSARHARRAAADRSPSSSSSSQLGTNTPPTERSRASWLSSSSSSTTAAAPSRRLYATARS